MEVPYLALERWTKYTAVAACGSWIFLGSNGIVLGGIGGLASLLVFCCCLQKNDETQTQKVVLGRWTVLALLVAVLLHLSALALGVIAIDFYITYPEKDWGWSLFGKGARSSWVVLSVIFSLVNIAAGIINIMMIRRFSNCNCCINEIRS